MTEKKNQAHCSVPFCHSNKQKQPYLSFYGFPSDNKMKKKWILAIKWAEGKQFNIKISSTFICSRHFKEADYTASRLAAKATIERLRPGVVPSLFEWNDYGMSVQKESAFERASRGLGHDVCPAPVLPIEEPAVPVEPVREIAQDHDYGAASKPGKFTI